MGYIMIWENKKGRYSDPLSSVKVRGSDHDMSPVRLCCRFFVAKIGLCEHGQGYIDP